MSGPQGLQPDDDRSREESRVTDQFIAQYRQAYPKLMSIAAGVLGRRDDAEDVVQQAAAIAVSKGLESKSGSSVVHWLSAIVRRCALNHRRKATRRRTYPSDPAEMQALVDGSSNPGPRLTDPGELTVQQDAFDDEVLHALQVLTPEARCCLLLRIVHGLNYSEISELLEIPEGTAMSHVHRGKRKLRTLLANHCNDGRLAPTRPE